MKFIFKPEFKKLPAGRDSQFHVVTSVSIPQNSEVESKRTPLSIAIAIDSSGSMEGAKIEQTRQALLDIVNILTRKDRLALITFSEDVQCIYELDFLTNKQKVREIIGQIIAYGGTNLSGGWLNAVNQLKAGFDADGLNRVFLLTDGEANVGIVNPAELARIGSVNRDKGITTTAFGFGHGFNETLLKSIATNSGGNFYYAEKPEDISTAFSCEFGEVIDLAGQNCELSFDFPDGVEFIENISPFGCKVTGQNVRYSVGDMVPDLSQEIVFKIRTSAEFCRGNPDLFKVSGSYNETSGNYDVKHEEKQMKIAFSSARGRCRFNADEEVVDTVIVARSIMAKELAFKEASAGHKKEAADLISERVQVISDRLDQSADCDRERLLVEKQLLEKVINDLNLTPATAGKTIKGQIEEFIKKRGAYLGIKQDKKYAINTSVAAYNTAEQKEIRDGLIGGLQDLGLESEFRKSCITCFNELLANAVEHGCKGLADAGIDIHAVFRRGSALIQVSDPGKGFDYEKVVKKAKNAGKTTGSAKKSRRKTELSERGRGIPLLLSLADDVNYTNKGRDVQVKLTTKVKEGLISFDNSSLQRNGVHSNFSIQLKNHKVADKVVAEMIITGELDMFTNPAIKNAYQQICENGNADIILNLSGVGGIDSSGLGLFVVIHKTAFKFGGKLVLSNVSGHIMNIFRTTKINDAFDISQDVNEALKLFEEKK